MDLTEVDLLIAPARHWVGRPAKHACEGGGLPRERNTVVRTKNTVLRFVRAALENYLPDFIAPITLNFSPFPTARERVM